MITVKKQWSLINKNGLNSATSVGDNYDNNNYDYNNDIANGSNSTDNDSLIDYSSDEE